ncbi:MAG TPA: thioredoxin [Candidatus Nanoarchaeia archaeon]|nr:thioredoxin [Candidatus Nanoarchaeia archaeon]
MGDALALTTGTFDARTKKGNLVIDFWAEWCGPCKIMAPYFEEAARELKDVIFAKVNVDENFELAERFGIMSIPTTLFMKDGEVVDRVSGALYKEDILKRAKDAFR